MKELEVKSMLADPNIPDSYKLGGRLDERFLAGVEYAEAAMEKSPELWVARDGGGYPSTYLFTKKPKVNCDCFLPIDGDVAMETFEDLFPNLTFGNSPRKVRLILED
jgi:hypothetical protein